ncbi:MAG: TIGR03621 family F420-dependent LLM class oxidoreductase [Actinobacteria bacterium]|nr:TIGR03621 family F420-dependent LLM class oxidoreductase [Actinomycetota bacterium]
MTASNAQSRDFRFGFTLGTHYTRQSLVDTCRRAEAFGFDSAGGVDHLGPNRTSPLLAAMAAAYASDHLTVGSYVLNIGFWNPSVLARDVATLMRLTDGRLELGLGTGLLKYQFDDAGFEFQSFQERHERVGTTLAKVRELLALEQDMRMPRVLIGSGGERMIRLAAEQADIFSLGGRLQVAGEPPATLRLKTAAETDERMKYFCSVAGDRLDEIERNAFILGVYPTDDRRKAAEQAMEDFGDYLSMEEMLECPFLLMGTEEEIARQIVESRERYGFTYFTVQRPHMDLLGPSIKLVRDLV